MALPKVDMLGFLPPELRLKIYSYVFSTGDEELIVLRAMRRGERVICRQWSSTFISLLVTRRLMVRMGCALISSGRYPKKGPETIPPPKKNVRN